ncbi:MAG TPA: hypothetical protein PLO55_11980 [Thermotogota bacterium]|nr:hypothetical protein [Thermotogota bacterium]
MQTLNRSGIEHKNDDKTITAWRIADGEWYVKIPAQYREYTTQHRVAAIYRRFGKIESYQYRVTDRELEEMESLIGIEKEVILPD